MKDALQQILTTEDQKALEKTISSGRLGTYLKAAGHDSLRAINLYLWNARVGEAFHVPIQAIEVALRNSVNVALSAEFGDHWWEAPAFAAVADDERKGDIEIVLRRIKNRGLELGNGQVVAGLSFGFWVGALQPRYNPPLWGAHLRSVFPNLPKNRGRQSLAESASSVAYLRNRIWHHEPIIKLDLLGYHGRLMTFLEWLCPTSARWLKPHCRVPELLRLKP